jgi:hypothetical protein
MIRKPSSMAPEQALSLIAGALRAVNRLRAANHVQPLSRGEFAERDGLIAEDGTVIIRDIAVTYAIAGGVVSAEPSGAQWPAKSLLTGAPSPAIAGKS